jgi:hypothetical protein
MTPACARDHFNRLERQLCVNVQTTQPLDDVEKSLETDGREMLRLLLQQHIHHRGNGDVGEAIVTCGKQQGVLLNRKRLDTRSMTTLMGDIQIPRVAYFADSHPAIHPVDEMLQLPRRGYSYELQRRMVMMAVLGPFDEAAALVLDTMGQRIPKRSIEEILIDASADFDAFYTQRIAPSTNLNDPIVVAAVDCKGIPMVKAELADKPIRRGKGQKAQKKKMATVAAVFTQQPFFRTAHEVVDSLFRSPDTQQPQRRRETRCHDKRVWASLTAGKDGVIAEVVKEVARRNPRQDKLVVAVTDGERALQQRIPRQLKSVTLILDLAHVLEKVWTAAHVFHAEGSLEAQMLVREKTLWILQGKVGQVVKGLRSMMSRRRIKGAGRQSLIKVSRYLYKNRTRMRYHEYLAKGLPIASGAVEGACKNLIKDRMERSGMRWTARMAEAMVKMRALYLSDDLDDYWDFHIAQEQERLYSIKWKVANLK